jgi:hypothetical protein
MQSKCKCGRTIHVTPEQRQLIRSFYSKYPWCEQKDLGQLFNISQARISEIIRADKVKGGE